MPLPPVAGGSEGPRGPAPSQSSPSHSPPGPSVPPAPLQAFRAGLARTFSVPQPTLAPRCSRALAQSRGCDLLCVVFLSCLRRAGLPWFGRPRGDRPEPWAPQQSRLPCQPLTTYCDPEPGFPPFPNIGYPWGSGTAPSPRSSQTAPSCR